LKGGGNIVKIDCNDIMFGAGVILFSYGLWLFSPAVSCILTGVIFMAVGWLRAGGN